MRGCNTLGVLTGEVLCSDGITCSVNGVCIADVLAGMGAAPAAPVAASRAPPNLTLTLTSAVGMVSASYAAALLMN